jgi:hypothetical protein
MRLFSLILAALLAMSVLAVVPFHERRDVGKFSGIRSLTQEANLPLEMPPGAYWQGNTLVLPENYDADEEDEDDDYQFEHGIQERAADNQIDGVFNMTATTQSGPNWGTDAYAVDIRVSKDQWSHVGTLRKYRLWKAVYNCLKLVGEPQPGDEPLERCSSHYEFARRPCRYYHCVMPNAIVYENPPGSSKYATRDAHVDIQADWSELIESKYPGIRDLAVSSLTLAS